ncbi:MAG: diguanylate cyclase [Spirochaetaceae bacterium]
MSSEQHGRRNDDLYKRLLAEGTSAEEIDQVYRKLRDKGYGDEAAKARMEREMRRMRTQNALRERRAGRGRHETSRKKASASPKQAPPTGPDKEHEPREGSHKRRSQDWFPPVSPVLRRTVNAWAFRNSLLAVGLRERWYDFLSLFRRDVPDYVNVRLLRYIAQSQKTPSGNPYEYSLRESLEALRTAAGTFLARPGNEDTAKTVAEALHRRDSLAAALLETFFDISKETRTALRYLELTVQKARRVTTAELARIAREVYRLVLQIHRISPGKFTELLALAKDVALAYRAAPASRLEDAEAVLRIAVDNFGRFQRELYPIVLKGIGSFYEPRDTSAQKHNAILRFAGLQEEDILDPGTFYETETKRHEQEIAAKQKREIEWLEKEKTEEFSRRFAGILGVLGVLFPNSDIENLERMPYLLPYFDRYVYSNRLPFSHNLQDIRAVAAQDPGQPLLVLHRIIDDLLGSLRPGSVEQATNRDGIAERLHEVNEGWHAVYLELFDRYLRALTNYQKSMEDADYARTFRNSAAARGLVEEINRLRNLLIRDYGHTLGGRAGLRGPKLFEEAERLQAILGEIAEDINQDLLDRTDPLGKRIHEEIGRDHVVELAIPAPGNPGYRPASRQVKRYIEAKYGAEAMRLPRLSQLFFLDVLRGMADMYSYLTNEPESFLRTVGGEVVLPGDNEKQAWDRENERTGRTAEQQLQIRLSDQLAAAQTDGLTGLKNKAYLMQELPKTFAELKNNGGEAALLIVDVDHFKWINDNLGHQKGDTILQDTARTLSENSRGTHDRTIRYGGEEFVLFVQGSLHSAVLLAERLRHLQERRVAESELYKPVRGVQDQKGGVCGTFSIGVAAAHGYSAIDEAIEYADKALYRAKETRNAVFLEADSSTHELLSYEQYLRVMRTKR